MVHGNLILDTDYLKQRGWPKRIYQDAECTIPIPDDKIPIIHSMKLMTNGEIAIPAVYPTVYQQQIFSIEIRALVCLSNRKLMKMV